MERKTIFISKATPGDDEFVLWLAPRLEAAGYNVFADILTLEGGDRGRKEITSTLQNKAIKMLLCCKDSSLEKNGVQEEIGIAEEVCKELHDPRFIIPLRLERYKKLFGIGELQYINFVGSWASGLNDLLETLENQGVPRSEDKIIINPNWENYKKRLSIKIEESPEILTTNWLRISKVPEYIRYYRPPGAVDHILMSRLCKDCSYPAEIYFRGFFSFATPEEIEKDFSSAGKYVLHSEYNLMKFLDNGSTEPSIRSKEAKSVVSTMFRKSWENYCRMKGFYEHLYSTQPGFHVTKNHVGLGRKIAWGEKGKRRYSMLLNIADGKVWRYGVSATPCFWPFLHFRIKARVLFSASSGEESSNIFFDTDKQHSFRRTICKGWRNKAWHGRFMAFLVLLSGESPFIELPLSRFCSLKIDATPIHVTSPITTILPDEMPEEAIEIDSSVLGNVDMEDDD